MAIPPRQAFIVLALCGLLSAYGAIWLTLLSEGVSGIPYWPFTLIGVFGASIANSTGAGGGVVFVPAFSIAEAQTAITLSTNQIVAMSLLIQCFGMSVGSLTWLNRMAERPSELDLPQPVFWRIIGLSLTLCLPSIWMTQAIVRVDTDLLLILFKSFSLILGGLLLASTFRPTRAAPRSTLTPTDQGVILGLGAIGGVATALLSVGVGEFIALYLFLRGFSLNVSVAAAVIVTAISVIAAAPLAVLNGAPYWPIVAMAVPGVMLGGFLGRRIAQGLGPTRLKRLAALWIIGSSLYLIYVRLT